MEVARRQPNGWAYEVDWKYPATQHMPLEAIRCGWRVGPDGRLTGAFEPNPRYCAVERSTRDLKLYAHAAARTNREQWIIEIDARGEHLFPNISENMIRGWWYVDAHGRVTDRFRPNSSWIDDAQRAGEDQLQV